MFIFSELNSDFDVEALDQWSILQQERVVVADFLPQKSLTLLKL